MKAVVFHGIGDIRLDTVKDPKLKEPTDAIIKITSSAICGTDLHMVRGTMPGMKPAGISTFNSNAAATSPAASQ